jgi:hypothetical protein
MFEKCPFCKTLKHVAVRCVTCGFIAISAADPHSHTELEKYVPPAISKVTVVTSATSNFSPANGPVFTVRGWPPRST